MPEKFTQKDLDRAMGSLRLLKMNPLADPQAASALMDKLVVMCPHKEALQWLASRATDLYRDWPGVVELRALLCSRYRPADGIEVYSSVFPDAIPLEGPPQESALLALPPGHSASADPELEGTVADLAQRKSFPSGEVTWERCASCQGTGRHGEGYCGCSLGRDLERADNRVKVPQ